MVPGRRNRRRRRIFRRARRGRKRSERIRPPFAFAVVKKAKSDRLSPDNKDSPKDKATLSPATERRELVERGPRERAYASNKPRREAEGIHEHGGKKSHANDRDIQDAESSATFYFRWYFREFSVIPARLSLQSAIRREGSTFRHSASD